MKSAKVEFDKTFEPKVSDIDMVFIFNTEADRSAKARFQALNSLRPQRVELEQLLVKALKRKNFKIIASPLFATPLEFQHDIVKGIEHNFFRHPDLIFYSLLHRKYQNQTFSDSQAGKMLPALGRVFPSILQKIQIRRKEYLHYDAHEDYMGDFKTIAPPDFPKDLARTARLLATGGENPSSDIDFGLQDLIGFVRELKTETALYETLVRYSGRTKLEITVDEQMQLWEVIAQQIVLKVTKPQPVEDPNLASMLDRLATVERISEQSKSDDPIRSKAEKITTASINYIEGQVSYKDLQKNLNQSANKPDSRNKRIDFIKKLTKFTEADFRLFTTSYAPSFKPASNASITVLVTDYILFAESLLGPGLDQAMKDFQDFVSDSPAGGKQEIPGSLTSPQGTTMNLNQIVTLIENDKLADAVVELRSICEALRNRSIANDIMKTLVIIKRELTSLENKTLENSLHEKEIESRRNDFASRLLEVVHKLENH